MRHFFRRLRYAWVEILMFLVACSFFGGACIIQMQVWDECREQHSFWYCVYLTGGR